MLAMQKTQRPYTVVCLGLVLIFIPTRRSCACNKNALHCTENILIHALCLVFHLLLSVGQGGVGSGQSHDYSSY